MADRGTSGHAVRDAQRAATAEFANERVAAERTIRPGTDSSIRAHHGEHIRRHGRRGWIEHSVNGDADTASSVSAGANDTLAPFAAGAPGTGERVPADHVAAAAGAPIGQS